MHEFRVHHWSVEVEILQIDGTVACTLCGDNAVEVNLDCDHVDGGGTASAIGIGLLRTIFDAHVPV